MAGFSELIRNWYTENKRDLPWRRTNDPYRIWLSEIMLQQTRVEQGLSYYFEFESRFPTIVDFANASEDEILVMWQGLGYYSRARNMHKAAKTIRDEFNGVFPSEYKDILSLKGVGDYSASAISSFAYNLPYAVLDGNVYRVLSRYFNDTTTVNSSLGKKVFQQYANELLSQDDPATHNQAIMELGALICTPKKTKCQDCPINSSCLAFANNTVNELPVKERKIKKKDVYIDYLVFRTQESNTYIQKRGEKDIWANMYEFAVHESDEVLKTYPSAEVKEMKVHKLSHRNVYAKFWEINGEPKNDSGLKKIAVNDLENYAKSRLIENYLEISFLTE